MLRIIKKSWRVFTYFYDRFHEDGGPRNAASLAYATLLSIVPLMIISFSVLSLFPAFRGVGEVIQTFVLQNFVATSANVISTHLNEFVKQVSRLSYINIFFLAFVTILMIYNMVGAFNAIWHTKLERHFAVSFVIYLVVLLITPILFGVIMVMSSYLASLPLIAGAKFTALVKKPLLIMLPYIATFLTFTFFNWILPSVKVRLLHASIAGLITTILFEVGKHFFSVYLSYVPTYRLLYGALATIPIFLIWIYVSWMIILLGALFCNVMARGLPEELRG